MDVSGLFDAFSLVARDAQPVAFAISDLFGLVLSLRWFKRYHRQNR